MTQQLDIARGGYLLFRDHRKDSILNQRLVQYAFRAEVVDKDTGQIALEDMADIGDIAFAHFWEPQGNRREIGSHSFATPSVWLQNGPVPMRTRERDPDFRYKQLVPDIRPPGVGRPKGRGVKYIRPVVDKILPDGTPGIILAGSEEKEEELLFFPITSGDLVAHHLGAGPPRFSSIVHDIAGAAIDPERKAGLHTNMWVKRLPERFNEEYALAWNLTESRGDATGWGLFVAPESAGQNFDILALASHVWAGPFHPGFSGDKHSLGTNRDGEPLNAGHLDWQSYFVATTFFDGPLDLELKKHPKTLVGQFPFQVFSWWDPDVSHKFIDSKRSGKWRGHVKIPITYIPPPDEDIPPPTDEDIPPPTGGGRPPKRKPKPKKQTPTPRRKKLGEPTGGLPRVPEEPVPLPPLDRPLPSEPVPGTPEWDEWSKSFPENAKPKKKKQTRGVGRWATPHKTEYPGQMFKPQPVSVTGARDLRYGDNGLDDGMVKGWLDDPIVLQVEAFGKEIGDQFEKNLSGPKKYTGGTGTGGIAYFPPEIGMQDFLQDYAPVGVVLSDTYINKHPEKVHDSFGTIDPTLGRPVSGYKRTLESDGNMYHRQFDGSGDAIETGFQIYSHHLGVIGTSPPNILLQNIAVGNNLPSGFIRLVGTASFGGMTWIDIGEEMNGALTSLKIKVDGTDILIIDQTQIVIEGGSLVTKEISSPSNTANYGKWYTKTDGKPYFKASDGTEYDLSDVGSGDLVGPGSSTDNAIARFDSSTGKLLQNSVGILDDSGNLSGIASIDGSGGNLNITANVGGEVVFNNAGEDVDFRIEGSGDTELFSTDALNDNVCVGTVTSVGKLTVDQNSASGAKPVLSLDQADIDDTFVDFIGTSAGDDSRSISSHTGEADAKFGAIKIEINGVTKWLRVYDGPG